MCDSHRLEAPFADRPPCIFDRLLVSGPSATYRRDLDPFAWARETTVTLYSYGFYALTSPFEKHSNKRKKLTAPQPSSRISVSGVSAFPHAKENPLEPSVFQRYTLPQRAIWDLGPSYHASCVRQSHQFRYQIISFSSSSSSPPLTVPSNMATASAFSYAQAAKGQGTVPSNALSGQPVQDSQPSAAAPKTTIDVESAPESTDAVRSADSSANTEKQDIASNTGSEVEARSEDVQETRREPLREDDSGRLDRPWRRGDKGTRSSSTTTRSVDEQDSRRPRKSKKSKASEKQASDQSVTDKDQESEKETPKVELFEAPIPSINIWRQRAEAHLAKAKPSPMNPAEQATNGSPKPDVSPKVAENGVPAAGQRDSIPNGVKSHRKSVDAPRPERNASRGSRVADKDASRGDVPPSVADTTAWPTPETSIQDDKKKPAEKSDRPDRPEKDASEDSKPRQKGKWVTMDYVPSVNFETQLPQMRNSKPRGGARNANGSRATGASHASDKATAPVASQGKPNENSSSSSKDRPRDGANGQNRNAPLPQTSKRSSTDMSNAREQRKAANHAGNDKNKDATSNSNVSDFLINTTANKEGGWKRKRKLSYQPHRHFPGMMC